MTAQQKSFKVLVIGESCIDQYFMCRNTRLNPESSAPLVQIGSTYFKQGMAGNVAGCLKNLGFKVFRLQSSNSCTKTRYVNAVTKEQLLRVDHDPKIDRLTPTEVENKLIDRYDAIVISDYDKGFLDYAIINFIAGIYNGPIFLDTKKTDLQYFNKNIMLKINEHEANAATEVPENTIVTMGAYGAIWRNTRWPAYKSETVDVCGAGDAFLAGMVYGYMNTLSEMIECGIVNAGLSVRHIGTYAPTEQELQDGLDDYTQWRRKNKQRVGQ